MAALEGSVARVRNGRPQRPLFDARSDRDVDRAARGGAGGRRDTNDAVLGALQVAWIIPQRSTALVNMRALGSERRAAAPAPGREGWRVYTWLAKDVTNKRPIKLTFLRLARDSAAGIELLDSNAALPFEVGVSFEEHREAMRLEGWPHGTDSRPSFEKLASKALRMRTAPGTFRYPGVTWSKRSPLEPATAPVVLRRASQR